MGGGEGIGAECRFFCRFFCEDLPEDIVNEEQD